MLINPRLGRPVHKLLPCLIIARRILVVALQTEQEQVRHSAQAAPASPHDLAETWQGTLHAGQDLRTMVKITKDDKGAYKGRSTASIRAANR